MNKVVQRLLVFFIGIPVVLGIVYFSYLNHLLLNIVLVVCSGIATSELFNLYAKKTPLISKPFLIILSSLMPIVAYLSVIFNFDTEYINWTFIFSIFLVLAVEVFTHKTFEDSNLRISSSVFVIFYGGYLLTFITRISTLQNSVLFLSLFLFLVFICDSLAWLFGVLFGKNNRGYVAASPNKSIVGFIGGYIGSIGSALLARCIWPEIFYGSFVKSIILGILVASSGIIGDLVESVFKRSSDTKDSGNVILGRGGLLDSIDSILYAAPIFYVAVHFLYS